MLKQVIEAVRENWNTSWKTTLSGILTFGCMITIVWYPAYRETAMDLALIAIATGLITAGDSNKITTLLKAKLPPEKDK